MPDFYRYFLMRQLPACNILAEAYRIIPPPLSVHDLGGRCSFPLLVSPQFLAQPFERRTSVTQVQACVVKPFEMYFGECGNMVLAVCGRAYARGCEILCDDAHRQVAPRTEIIR